MAQMEKNLPAMQGTWVQRLGQEYSLEEEIKPTWVFLSEEVHELKSLAGYSSWGHKELDMTERIILSPRLSLSIICWKFIQGFACINSSFLFMADSSWCGCTLVCLTIHPLKDTGVVFHLGPLRVKIFMNIYV